MKFGQTNPGVFITMCSVSQIVCIIDIGENNVYLLMINDLVFLHYCNLFFLRYICIWKLTSENVTKLHHLVSYPDGSK